jgi:hypothetical protein
VAKDLSAAVGNVGVGLVTFIEHAAAFDAGNKIVIGRMGAARFAAPVAVSQFIDEALHGAAANPFTVMELVRLLVITPAAFLAPDADPSHHHANAFRRHPELIAEAIFVQHGDDEIAMALGESGGADLGNPGERRRCLFAFLRIRTAVCCVC